MWGWLPRDVTGLIFLRKGRGAEHTEHTGFQPGSRADPCPLAEDHEHPRSGPGFIPKSIGWTLTLPKIFLHRHCAKSIPLPHCVRCYCHMLTKRVFFCSTHYSWITVPCRGPGPTEFLRCQNGAEVSGAEDCSFKGCLQASFLKGSCQLLACQPAPAPRDCSSSFSLMLSKCCSCGCCACTLRNLDSRGGGRAGGKRNENAFDCWGTCSVERLRDHRENLQQRLELQLDPRLFI